MRVFGWKTLMRNESKGSLVSAFTFIYPQGFAPKYLHRSLDSFVSVSRRINKNHFVQDRDGT